jgi:hypothetical protein
VSLVRYSMIVAAMAVGSFAALWPSLGSRADGTRGAVALGTALAALNAVAAYALVVWSSGRSNVAFFRAVLGGTLGRMAFLLGIVVTAVIGLAIPRLPLVLALLSYYVAFLVLELAVVHRRPAEATR